MVTQLRQYIIVLSIRSSKHGYRLHGVCFTLPESNKKFEGV